MHIELTFPLTISSVNMQKATNLVTFTETIINRKFFVQRPKKFWKTVQQVFLRPATLLRNRQALVQVFSCEFAKFLKTLFSENTSGRLLLSIDIYE